MKNDFRSTLKQRIRQETRHMGILFLDLAILVMCAVFVYSIITVAISFYEIHDKGYDSEVLYYRLSDEDYARLADLTWQNRIYGRGNDEDSQKYYAVADYYEAAVQYRMCRELGDADGAENWLKKMTDAAGRMGVLAAEKEKIDQMLGLQ